MDLVSFYKDFKGFLRMNDGLIKQGFSWTEIYFRHFVQAAPILFGHLEIFLGHFFQH